MQHITPSFLHPFVRFLAKSVTVVIAYCYVELSLVLLIRAAQFVLRGSCAYS